MIIDWLVIGALAAAITKVGGRAFSEGVHAVRGTESEAMRRWLARQAIATATQPWHFNADGKTPFKRFWAGIWHNVWEDAHEARMRRRADKRADGDTTDDGDFDTTPGPGTFRYWWRLNWEAAAEKASNRYHAWRQQREADAAEAARRAADASTGDPVEAAFDSRVKDDQPPAPQAQPQPKSQPVAPPQVALPPAPPRTTPNPPPAEPPPAAPDGQPKTGGPTAEPPPFVPPPRQHDEPAADRSPIRVDSQIVRSDPAPRERTTPKQLAVTDKEHHMNDNTAIATATTANAPSRVGEVGTLARAQQFTTNMDGAIANAGERIIALASELNEQIAKAGQMVEQASSDLSGAGVTGPVITGYHSGSDHLNAANTAFKDGASNAIEQLEHARNSFAGSMQALNRHTTGQEYHRSNMDAGDKAYHANE